MYFKSLLELYPEVAARETRILTVLEDGELPKGQYAFVESFCDDPGCDCRRVYIRVVARSGSAPLATISFGWENERFYRNWSSFSLSAGDLAELKGPALVRMAPQSEHASVLLHYFKAMLDDKAYVERIVQHYNMFKESIDFQGAAASSPIRRSQPKIGRNEPCRCGSGKKFKRCCDLQTLEFQSPQN